MKLEDLKKFYKAKFWVDEQGIFILFREYVCVRETDHVCFCIEKSNFYSFTEKVKTGKMTVMQASKEVGVRKINKDYSRIAFPTKDLALQNLLYLKKKQIKHMERDLVFLKVLTDKVGSVSDLNPGYTYSCGQEFIVPNTGELFNNFFRFD